MTGYDEEYPDSPVKTCCTHPNPFCAGLSEQTRSQLCCVAHERSMPRGGFLAASLVEKQLCIVKEGALAMQIVKFSDGPGIMAFIGYPGYLCNIQRFVNENERATPSSKETGYGTALAPSVACLIPMQTARALFRNNKEFAWAMLEALTDQFRESTTRLSHVSGLTVFDELQWLVADLEHHGIDCSAITHEQFAQILGANRVTVSKCMRDIHFERT